jgi:hypothetical protein
MTRRSTWLAGALVVALAGCGDFVGPDPHIPEAMVGEYTLRLVGSDGDEWVAVPGSLPRLTPGDSVRIDGGVFTLRADGTWQVAVQSQPVFGGVPGQPQASVYAGNFAFKERTGERVVLDLYPNRFVTADRPWTLVVSGNTLYYGALVFVR